MSVSPHYVVYNMLSHCEFLVSSVFRSLSLLCVPVMSLCLISFSCSHFLLLVCHVYPFMFPQPVKSLPLFCVSSTPLSNSRFYILRLIMFPVLFDTLTFHCSVRLVLLPLWRQVHFYQLCSPCVSTPLIPLLCI